MKTEPMWEVNELSPAFLLELIKDFVDPDPCSFDHHGYCQAHCWFGEGCPHGRAQALLSHVKEPDGL